jgi:hypothetical protein
LLLVGALVALITFAWLTVATREPTNTAALPDATSNRPPTPSKAQAEWIDPRRLAASPSDFRDHNIALFGKALTVDQHPDYTRVQLMAQPPGGNVTALVVIELWPKAEEVRPGECYALFGVGLGTQHVTGALTGVEMEVPLVRGYSWEPSPPGPLGIDCAP